MDSKVKTTVQYSLLIVCKQTTELGEKTYKRINEGILLE
jgi:hypothetical protein